MHYHGTPVNPKSEVYKLAGRCFCVSFYDPRQVEICHQIGQAVMLDNGAFSAWRSGRETDWNGYYRWTEKWLAYPTTWAVIPDVINGGEAANDKLLTEWPHGNRGAPVWHLDEEIDRLKRLADDWPRVCVGSSGEYAQVGSPRWHNRMVQAMNRLCLSGVVPVWLHMLRGLNQCASGYPFASADSTDIARNFKDYKREPETIAARWDAIQCSPHWEQHPEQMNLSVA
jgi:hypothetical protein